MAKRTKSYGLNNPLQDVFPTPVIAQRAPKASDTNYELGQSWLDKSSDQMYALVKVVSGIASWAPLGAGSSSLSTLTGDTGGAISPTLGNIDIKGSDLLQVDGSVSTLTLTPSTGAYPTTPYVVGTSGKAGYTTIQSAIDAASLAGGGLVFIQPGSYTEDLNLVDGVDFIGSSLEHAIIIGNHTPPESGTISFKELTLSSATNIFTSAAAGSTNIFLKRCFFTVTNGFTFSLPNWTGSLAMDACGEGSTNNGVFNNTGGSFLGASDSDLGAGTGQTMIGSGRVILQHANIRCPVDLQTGSIVTCIGNTFEGTVTLSNNSTGSFNFCKFIGGATPSVSMNSSAPISILTSIIDSSNSPSIDGTGAGTLSLTGVDFLDNSDIAGTLTVAGGVSSSGTFTTLDQATGLIVSSNSIEANGTDVNIDITLSSKGTGTVLADTGDITASRSNNSADVKVSAINTDAIGTTSNAGFEAIVDGTSVDSDPYIKFSLTSAGKNWTAGIDNSTGEDDFVISDGSVLGTNDRLAIDGTSGDTKVRSNLAITNAGKTLAVQGGATTDFIGVGSLNSGTLTILNSNIAFQDRIFISRVGVGLGTTTFGVLVYTILDGVSFTIDSHQVGTPASIETNDDSEFVYFIVRQI